MWQWLVELVPPRWRRWPRTLKLTREGKYFIGITVGVGFAAINTGNNLLYLLLGMMLSLIIASGVMSESTLRDVDVTRSPPLRIHANRPFLMGIALKNEKHKLASFSVEVEDLIDDKPLDKKCYFLKIPAGRLQHTSYRHLFPRRGRYQFTGFRVSTKFPFALFRKSRRCDLPTEVIVFPELVPIRRAQPPRARSTGEEARGQRGRRGEFHGLREMREGDDPRDVHWSSTARKGRPIVREYEDEAARRVSIFLDNGLPENADEKLKDGLERAVSVCASLAADYLERGYLVRVVTRGEARPQWLSGPQQLVRLLRVLALLPVAAADAPYAAAAEGVADPILVVPRGRPHSFGQVVEA